MTTGLGKGILTPWFSCQQRLVPNLNAGTRERSKPQNLRSRLLSNQELPLKPCYKDQTPSNRGDAPMLIAFSAGLTGRDHAEVRALHMSWFARLVNRSMLEKRPEVRILAEENTSML